MNEQTVTIPASAMTKGSEMERPTTDVPIYASMVGQDKALTVLEEAVNRLLTTQRGVEHGTKTGTGKNPNEVPPTSMSQSVTDISIRVLRNTGIVEMMSTELDEITDELCRTRVGIGI